jgi:hypothetical protein
MATQVYEGQAAAEKNKAVEAVRLEGGGAVNFIVSNQGSANVVTQVTKGGTRVDTDKDTAVAVEDTLYNGDGATLAFSGEELDHLPVIPGSVTLSDAGSVGPDLVDRDGDGIFYTDDVDEDAAGTIDYFTGALILAYPTGKAPGTGADAINAAYSYQDAQQVPGGRRTFEIAASLPDEAVVCSVACDSQVGCLCRVDATVYRHI